MIHSSIQFYVQVPNFLHVLLIHLPAKLFRIIEKISNEMKILKDKMLHIIKLFYIFGKILK